MKRDRQRDAERASNGTWQAHEQSAQTPVGYKPVGYKSTLPPFGSGAAVTSVLVSAADDKERDETGPVTDRYDRDGWRVPH